MDHVNPYTAPGAGLVPGALATEAEEGRGVWRDDKALVMSKYARLPSRCVKCDRPATNRLRVTLSWHPPGLYWVLLLLPVGVILYLVLRLGERRSATIEVPLCHRHRAGRRGGILISWLLVPFGMVLLVTGFASMSPDFPDWSGDRDLATLLLVVCGASSMLLGLTCGLASSRVVGARKFDKTHLWLDKIHPGYLAALPPLPYGEEANPLKSDRSTTYEF